VKYLILGRSVGLHGYASPCVLDTGLMNLKMPPSEKNSANQSSAGILSVGLVQHRGLPGQMWRRSYQITNCHHRFPRVGQSRRFVLSCGAVQRARHHRPVDDAAHLFDAHDLYAIFCPFPSATSNVLATRASQHRYLLTVASPARPTVPILYYLRICLRCGAFT